MRGYLMLAGMALLAAMIAAATRVTPVTSAARNGAGGVVTYVIPPVIFQPSSRSLVALESHPSFMGFVPDFPEAYMRDACMRERFDRPVTMREPYVTGSANDETITRVMETLRERGENFEVQDANGKPFIVFPPPR